MATEPDGQEPSDLSAEAAEEDDLGAQLGAMVRAFWASPQRNVLFALALALVGVIGTTAWAQIRLNAWNQPFYNALTARDLPGFVIQLGVFAKLAGVLLALNVAQTWLNQMTRLKLRQGLVGDLFDKWLAPLRAFRLANAGPIGTNPDQRLAADAVHLTDLTTDLGIGLLQSTLLLGSFISVLWGVSAGMGVTLFGIAINPPGYMVWCALLYACTASFLSWAIGRPLVRLDAEHYAREADLRYELVRVSEGVEAIAMYGGEAVERARLNLTFGTVLTISRKIVGAVTRLTWITAGYGWFTLVAPILVAMPSYFAGKMSFGALMVVVGAFNQVQQSLRWYVDNFSTIADWRATLLRVAAFRKAVIAMDRLGQSAPRFTLTEAAGPGISIADLCIAGPNGAVRLQPATMALKPGDRVLFSGGHGEGKTLFFRALIGLWPWGSGSVERPNRAQIMFLPARAYLPTGTLRACLTYPHPETAFADAAIAAALADVGLQRLAPQLDKSDRWEHHLSENEKHCLAFARVLLQHPVWVVIDDTLNLIEAGIRQQIEGIFMSRLTDMGVITIGHDGDIPGFYTQQATLTLDPEGAKFTTDGTTS